MNFYCDYIVGSTQLIAIFYALTAGRKGTKMIAFDAEQLFALNNLNQVLVAGC